MSTTPTFESNLLLSRQSLMQAAYKFTQDPEVAEDLLQDTMLKAFRYQDKYQPGTNMNGWLFTILRNTFINDYRVTTRRNALITVEDELSSAQLYSSAVVNASYATFVMRDIQKALGQIPQHYSRSFLRYFEGYKYEEIAEEFCLPIGTVKTQIHMARKLLQKQLKAYRRKAGK